MRNFLQNWNYKKHASAVSCIYMGIAIIGNAFVGKKIPEDEKSLNPKSISKQMTKKQWIFNGILTGIYCIEMSATYTLLRHYKKQYK